MAGIHDYVDFWNALEDRQIVKDEYQVIHGFDGLENIRLIDFTWYANKTKLFFFRFD